VRRYTVRVQYWTFRTVQYYCTWFQNRFAFILCTVHITVVDWNAPIRIVQCRVLLRSTLLLAYNPEYSTVHYSTVRHCSIGEFQRTGKYCTVVLNKKFRMIGQRTSFSAENNVDDAPVRMLSYCPVSSIERTLRYSYANVQSGKTEALTVRT